MKEFMLMFYQVAPLMLESFFAGICVADDID